MRGRHTIELVVKRKLCTGCGTCAGVCPQDALKMVTKRGKGCYVPQLDKDRCTRCGLCHDACPGHGVNFESLNASLFGDIHEDIALGRYLASYIGHAIDRDVRYGSTSGGLVSALLVFALRKGLIDGVLVTRMRSDDPLKPEAFIARNEDEILSAAGSKYCQAAAGTALKEILDSEGRFAVVGLPCHIQGIRKAERRIPTLRERIRYRISVACSLNFSFRGTERVLKSRGITPDSVDALQYRGRGWPGSALVCLTDGTERTIPHSEFHKELGPYSLRRCTLCSDMLGELSDLTCGDAWIGEAKRDISRLGTGPKSAGSDLGARPLPHVMRTDRPGSSFVVSRTPEGEGLLENAASCLAVELSELDLRELLASQDHALFKKRKLAARMRLFELTGRSVPMYRQKLLSPTRGDYIDMMKFYAARYVLSGRHRLLRPLFHAARRLKRAALRRPRAPAELMVGNELSSEIA